MERPASAVKELVENSLDAQATDIVVEVEGGGLTLIRVTDNGHGMDKDDLAVSILRHATSKLASITDLFTITTLGFRGEALPSIASVSHLTIKSRQRDSDYGHMLSCITGERQEIQITGMPVGTIIEVGHLFANVPARLKFMKSARAEGQRIAQCMERLALSHPAVRFTLVLDGRTALQSSGSSSLSDTAAAIFGADAAKHLWAFTAVKGRNITMSGVLARPAFTRGNRGWQYFFLNGRCIEHRGLSVALDEAYRTLLPATRFPVAAVHVTVNPAAVDVNVHPAKTEVRFSDERAVVAEAITLLRAQVAEMNRPKYHLGSGSLTSPPPPWRDDFPRLAKPSSAQVSYLPKVPYRLVGQVMNSYLVIERDGKLVVVDQHAAHERILFEKLLQKNTLEVLNLAIPLTVDLGSAVVSADHLSAIARLGIACEHFGGSTYLVRSIPAVYRGYFDQQTLRELLTDLSEDRTLLAAEETLAQALACRAAIKAHTKLSPAEMVELLDKLYATDRSVACPHGRPVELSYTEEELFRLFHPK